MARFISFAQASLAVFITFQVTATPANLTAPTQKPSLGTPHMTGTPWNSTCRSTSFPGSFVSTTTITSRSIRTIVLRNDCPAATSEIGACPTLCAATLLAPTLSNLGFCAQSTVSGVFCQKCLPLCSNHTSSPSHGVLGSMRTAMPTAPPIKNITDPSPTSSSDWAATTTTDSTSTTKTDLTSMDSTDSTSTSSTDSASPSPTCTRPILNASILSRDRSCPTDRPCPWRCTDRSFFRNPLYYCADCNLFNVSPEGLSFCSPCTSG